MKFQIASGSSRAIFKPLQKLSQTGFFLNDPVFGIVRIFDIPIGRLSQRFACIAFDLIADTALLAAVPVSHVSDFILKLKELAAEYHTDTNIIAHIADGNVHNDILYLPDGTIPDYADELKHRMYQLCAGFDGTVTGEHGIGKIRVEELKNQNVKVLDVDPVKKRIGLTMRMDQK